MDIVEQLWRSVDSRMTPERVCVLIFQALTGRMLPAERRMLARVADNRPARYSSMSDDFERPVPAEHKVRMLNTLLPGAHLSDENRALLAGDPWVLLGQLHTVALAVGWQLDASVAGRLTRAELAERGSALSKRQYTRLVRHLRRTAGRARRLQQQILLRQLTMVGRSGLAYSITLEEMHGDVDAACFVAYWVAQKNRRRAFTLDGRDNPFDTIAQMLLERCQRRAGRTDWWMVARAYPDPVVVARLDDEQRGKLIANWFGLVTLGANMLRELYAAWPAQFVEPVVPDSMWKDRPGLMPTTEARGGGWRPAVDLRTMIVRKGVDLSTWNIVAQAYNTARAGWINCLGAAGALELLDAVCPGKAMRLIATDLAAYHRMTGGGPDRQTGVWADLPMPWDVMSGDQPCPAELVEDICHQHGIDPHATGWTAPRQHAGRVAAFKATPELVHGIEVADPLLAGLLRRAGAFSGKPLTPEALDLVALHTKESLAGGA